MPLHLDAITKSYSNETLMWIFQNCFNECQDIVVSADKNYFHCSKPIYNIITQEKIGEFVFTATINAEQKSMEILDVDIVLTNQEYASLKFIEKLNNSSSSNEYYDVETLEQNQRFQIETVHRYVVPEDVTGKIHKVSLSAFSFKLTIYDDINAFNKYIGFSDNIKVASTDMTVLGLSETFIAPSDLFKADINTCETFSFVIGKVKSFENVSVILNNSIIKFIIAQIETGAGNMPVAMSKDVFNLNILDIGKIIVMYADIKADFKI